jgi:hypothetical protein
MESNAGALQASDRKVADFLHVLTVLGSIALAAYVIWESSYPFMDLDALLSSALGAFAVGVAWVVSLLAEWISVRRSWRRAALAPLLGALCAAVVATHIPKVIRVLVSEGPLLETIASYERGELESDHFDEYEIWFWAGAVPIYGIDTQAEHTHLIAGIIGSDSGAGLAYLPNGPVERDPSALLYPPEYEHLYGAWYRWR